MKKPIFYLFGACVAWNACTISPTPNTATEMNPFFEEYTTAFQIPPFDKIREEHYIPAFKEGMKQHALEIDKIINNEAAADFKNTIEALDGAGTLLNKVSDVFFNIKETNSNDTLADIAREMSPLLSKHNDDINLNPKLFARIKSIYDKREELQLSKQQNTLLDNMYQGFIRNGAELSEDKQAELRKINEELSMLTLEFGNNLLKESSNFKLIIKKEEDLEGLPQNVIGAALDEAKEEGLEGKWIFTLDKPSFIPFLQYSKKRDLREKIYKAYNQKGNNNNEWDNKEIVSKIVVLRTQRAKLLGYKNHAEFILERNMAKNAANVYKLLDELMDAALPIAKEEARSLQEIINREEKPFKLEAWDWWYYTEKLRKEKYAMDDELLRPYFKLDNVREGLFEVIKRLYGVQFHERNDLPVYNKDVQAFEAKESDGTHLGILFLDFFPRKGKGFGAWATGFRGQYYKDGKKVNPIVSTVYNFTKAGKGKPVLLSSEEVNTFFHEMGHAMDDLFRDLQYKGLYTPSDFVELPSQVMENWVEEPEVLRMFARHYEDNSPIPDSLIEGISKSSHFNMGFVTVEYLAAAFLDMEWHTLSEIKPIDVEAFENASMHKIGLLPEIGVRYKSTFFSHIFSGGYSAGYYSYIWAEILDADAFDAFKETSLFDQKTAQAFRKNVLELGGSEDPMELYKRFRGVEPKIEALLKRRGLLKEEVSSN